MEQQAGDGAPMRPRDAVDDRQRACAQLPPPRVDVATGQASVSVMATLHGGLARIGAELYGSWTRTARHAKPMPHFGGVLVIYLDRVVRGRTALAQPLRSDAVTRGSGVHEYATSSCAQLEAQRVCMRMAGDVVRPNGRTIDQRQQIVLLQPHVAARLEQHALALGPRQCGGQYPGDILLELRRFCSDAESSVIEERDAPVRMTHAPLPRAHPESGRLPAGRYVESVRLQRVDGIEHILEDDGLVHRAALEVAAVGEDLFLELPAEQLAPLSQPALGLFSGEIGPCANQRARIREQMVTS